MPHFSNPQHEMDWADRYTTPLAAVFTRQHKLDLEHRVELALLKALGELGMAPPEAYVEVKEAVESESTWLCGLPRAVEASTGAREGWLCL
jgi:adenylosuccinate lyase